jgi:hypothetical protein
MNENHKNHKLEWMELHRTGGDDKVVAIEALGLPDVCWNCYACENANFRGQDIGACEKCPLRWTNAKARFCLCELDQNSPYARWLKAKTPRTRKKYAKIIANMKWRTKK